MRKLVNVKILGELIVILNVMVRWIMGIWGFINEYLMGKIELELISLIFNNVWNKFELKLRDL